MSGVELEGGTLTSSAGDLVSLLVRPVVPAFAWGWVWNVVVGGWSVVGTLLGPEGTGRLPGGGWVVRSWEAIWSSYRPGCPGAGGGWRVVIFRTLRTAQWTRASCKYCVVFVWPSF